MTLCLMAALCIMFAVAATAADIKAIPIIVNNPSREAAVSAPVSAGVPFGRGALKDTAGLTLAGPDGKPVPTQAQCLAKWPDGSCRWVLVDFEASVAGGSDASFTLAAGGKAPAAKNPAQAVEDEKGITLSNGVITFRVEKGGAFGVLSSADGKASARVRSIVEIGPKEKRITSKVVVDSFDVYAKGPIRAAASIYGRRVYSDGMEGPFSRRVEVFAGSPYIRIEDTFMYAHFPGTHAKPQNPLGLWKFEVTPTAGKERLRILSLAADEEAEGLVVSESGVAFWGVDKPFDLSRHTDKELIGEDTPGIALGVGKSCAAAFGIVPEGSGEDSLPRPSRDVRAHTTPEVYAGSGALAGFAAEVPGKYVEAEEGLKQILGFWLWWQDNDPKGSFDKGPWHGLFDWGDWQLRYTDVHGKPTGWPYYEGRYGWDCNEMDTTLMLWNAFLHTGRGEYWRAAVAMSRHTMDVDMINVDYRKYKLPDYVYDPHSYGAPWKEGQDRLKAINTIGLGRRHNVQHWGNGVGDTRHTWNGGVIMYYYLTGNRRAYDAARVMADMHMQRIWGYAAGEYALSMWCINNAWELTGDKRYLDEFKYRLEVIYRLRLPDGSLPEHLDFDKKKGYPEVDGNRGTYMDIPLDYITNAMVEHYYDTGDKKAREIALGIAERIMKDPPVIGTGGQDVDTLRILAFAYEETGQKRFLDRAKTYLKTMETKPLPKWPTSGEEWVKFTYGLLEPHGWQIRHVGPGVRMLPYMLKAMADEEKGK